MGFKDKLMGLLGIEAQAEDAGPKPTQQETPDQTNERIARTAYPPDAYEKFKSRRAQKAAEEVMAVETGPEDELKRIREQLPYFAQFDPTKLNDEELTKLQTQLETELQNLAILPITEDTKSVQKLLEEKKTEIIEALTKQIERQVSA